MDQPSQKAAPLTRRQIREDQAGETPIPQTGRTANAAPPLTRSELRRRHGEHATARPPGKSVTVQFGHQAAQFAKSNSRPLAAAAAATLLVGGGAVAWGVAPSDQASASDSLSPLRVTLEQVSRRNIDQMASRSITTRAEAMPATQVTSQEQSNIALVLHFDRPTLTEGDSLSLRRSVGQEAPVSPAEGVEVAIPDGDEAVIDQGLLPDTTYSYTLFLLRAEDKPEALAHHTAVTSLYPTELLPGDSLVVGERLVSNNGAYYLTLNEQGQAVLLNDKGQKIWRLNAEAGAEAELVMSSAGALELINRGEPVWESATAHAGALAQVTDDGDVQLILDGAVVWSSVDHGDQLRGADSPFAVSSQGWTQPAAGKLSSPYGGRQHPIFGGYRQHEGLDLLGGGSGKPIYAAADGVVSSVRVDSGGNPTLIIDHGNGVETRYLHWDGMNNVLVKEGQKVVAGQQVARVGNSGNSTGPHLHFEVRINGQSTDPLPYLQKLGVQWDGL